MQSEIPEDVMKAAQDAFAKLADTYGSSAAMVFPIARAIMTERERHVSTILTGEMIEAAKSAYSECEFRTDEQVNSSITLIVRAALEAALSTDAEPVATVAEMGVGGVRVLMPHPPGSTQHLPVGTKLYAEPVKTAPAVAVKADLPERFEEWWAGRDSKGEKTLDYNQRKQLAWDAFYAAALSAQVQDVAGWQREHEALGKLIRLLDAEPSIGDAEMADALEHARCVWDHSHAPDGSPVSPASKHGDAE